MMGGQGCAQRGDAVLPSVLVKGQYIEVTLNNDHMILLLNIPFGHRETVEKLPFMVEGRFWRVEIFRLAFSHHPSSESDHPVMKIEDGKEDSPSKTVVPPLFFLRKDQAQFTGHLH